MKLDKLAKQLRRDLFANPKKAGLLGLMVLVAAYFWLPLVKGWVMPAKPATIAAAPGLTPTDNPATPQPTPKGGLGFRWDRVRELIARDTRMASAQLDAGVVDPFAGQEPPHETTHEEPEPAVEPPPADIDPTSLGLTLTSVVVGSRRSTAMISGRAFREGETIKVSSPGQNAKLEFLLARVERYGVVLERSGHKWQLKLPQPASASDEIQSGTD